MFFECSLVMPSQVTPNHRSAFAEHPLHGLAHRWALDCAAWRRRRKQHRLRLGPNLPRHPAQAFRGAGTTQWVHAPRRPKAKLSAYDKPRRGGGSFVSNSK